MSQTIKIGEIAVMVDTERGTIRPATHADGMRLGVGYSADTTDEMEQQRYRRGAAYDRAVEECGEPEYGWTWADHLGHTCPILS